MQMQHNTRKKQKIQNLACHTDMLALLIIMHAVIALLTKVCVHTIAEHREAIPVNTATQKKQQMAVHEVKKKKTCGSSGQRSTTEIYTLVQRTRPKENKR